MIYLLRHGQTDWNIIHKLQGVTDIPLNDTGRQMAIDAGEKYKEVDFSCCYCSPLMRAKETAELFLEHKNVPIIEDDRLKEMCFGEFEGVENADGDENIPVYKLFHEPEKFQPQKGMESFDELFSRTSSMVEEIKNNHDIEKNNVLIVGHGAMCSGIICTYERVQLKDFWTTLLKNCELYELKMV
ncbi:MAG: histidine phosphatase family protein [Lachnospiraceae bacterium]|nr:histidine phosphatase family protein [Lachnospiraceae bacterium]